MTQKKKLDLKELELQLPPMDSNETKIILGGNDYGDDDSSIFHLINAEADTIVHIVENCINGDGIFGGGGHGNNNGGGDDDGEYDGEYDQGYADQGDLDHYFDNAGNDDDGNPNPGTPGFSVSAAVSSITSQVNEVYNGLSQTQIENSFTFDSDFTTYSVFGSQLSNILATNSCIAQLVGSITANTGSHINFDIVQGLPAGQFGQTNFNPNTGVITIELNQSWLSQNIGWNVDNSTPLSHPNSYGINYAALGMNEDFVALLTHELVHAQNQSLIINALQHVPSHSFAEVRDYMLNNLNVDPNLVNAFFIVNPTTNEVTFNLDGTLEHQWMTNPNNGVVATTMAAVNEFIADLQNMQEAVNDLTDLMHFAQQEANPGSPANPEGGEGYPTHEEWQEIFEGLEDNLNDIKNNWGSWLNYNGY